MKAYDCVVCRKRVNPRDRRPVPKTSKKIVSKLICRQVTSDDQICSKCRLNALRSNKQATTSSGDNLDKHTVAVKEKLKSPQNIQLNIQSTPRNNKRCVICKRSKNLTRVGSTAISQAFIDKGVYINPQSRCCREHMQRAYFTAEALTKLSATKKSEFFSRKDITVLINGIRDNVKGKGHLNFDNPAALSTEEYTNITGLSKDQFHDLAGQLTSSVRNNSNRSSRTCLAIFMAKMKTGLPNAILGTIFNLNTAQVQRIIPRVRKCLMEIFVPAHLGFGHLDHNGFVENHTTPIAKELFTTGKEAVLVLDGTYLYIQKSMDYKFQRMSYSLHKNRPLVKPMMVVGTDGYILSVLGPYLADYGNNDASITKHILNHNLEEIRTWLKKDDVFIVDRGFRDAVHYLEQIGLKVKMPSYLAKGKKQHTTEESNLSRLVTKVRWVVESVNGRLKQFRLFDKVLPNTLVPHVGDLVKIVCAICNRYKKPLASMDPGTQAVAVQMLERAGKSNNVQVLVEENGLLNKRSMYKPLDGTSSTDLDDFPHMSLDDLREITMGVYQVKQAPAYTKEHTDDDGGYELMTCRDLPDLLRVKIQSRHSKNAIHTLWIQYSSDTGDIRGWYCTCKVGARVVGCCAHIASVLWFLGWKRHLEVEQIGKPGLASSCLNAASSSGTFSENDTLEE